MEPTERNLCASAEIPSTIFVQLVSEISQRPSEVVALIRESGALPSLRLVLCISQVCRHWRALIFDIPSLWSWPWFKEPNLAAQMLERAKTAPLTICLHVQRRESISLNQIHRTKREDVMVRALQKMTQIEFLSITHLDTTPFDHPPLDLAEDIPSLLQPAPLLDTFVFHSSGQSEGVLPNDLFNRDATRLRHIQLKNWTLRWTQEWIQPFESLTTLIIVYQTLAAGPPASRQLTVQAVSCLRFLPRLEVLHLGGALNLIDHGGLREPPSEEFPVATLPSLRYMYLYAYSPLLYSILDRIRYPPTANIQLDEASGSERDHFHLILRSLNERLEGDLRFISFSKDGPSSFTAGTSVLTSRGVPEYRRSPSQFTYRSAYKRHQMYACEILSLHSLEFLKLKMSPPFDADIWRKLGKLESLRTIDVAGGAAKALMAFALLTYTQDDQPQIEIPFFPALKDLIIRSVFVAEAVDTEGEISDEVKILPYPFKYFFQARRKSGCPLRRIELIKSVMDSALVEELKALEEEVVLTEVGLFDEETEFVVG